MPGIQQCPTTHLVKGASVYHTASNIYMVFSCRVGVTDRNHEYRVDGPNHSSLLSLYQVHGSESGSKHLTEESRCVRKGCKHSSFVFLLLVGFR